MLLGYKIKTRVQLDSALVYFSWFFKFSSSTNSFASDIRMNAYDDTHLEGSGAIFQVPLA